MTFVKKILFVDPSDEYRAYFADAIKKESDLIMVGHTDSAEELLSLVPKLHPDVVIMDLVFPDGEGISVLERLHSLKLEPKPIIIIHSIQQIMAELAMHSGANFFIAKPISVDALLLRTRQIIINTGKKPDAENSYESRINSILTELGLSMALKGFSLLREGILLRIQNFIESNFFSDNLYSVLAERHNTIWSSIQRCMFVVIKKAWDLGDSEVQERYFCKSVCTPKGKPSNREFIARIADHILVEDHKDF